MPSEVDNEFYPVRRLKGEKCPDVKLKKLKELLIDRKIPANMRSQIPVIADEKGVLGVYGIGANLDRVSPSGITIRFEKR